MAQTAGDAPRKVARQSVPPWLQLLAGRYASVVRCWSVKARTLVRDSAIILSFALQHGADIESIRRALCRDGEGQALGPIAMALDVLASGGKL